jgi:hypothetical protein
LIVVDNKWDKLQDLEIDTDLLLNPVDYTHHPPNPHLVSLNGRMKWAVYTRK